LSTEDGVPHKPFPLQALEKYFTLLTKRSITDDELFNSTCNDPNGSLTLDEFRQFVHKLKPGMQVKDLTAIKNFYDCNRDGLISRTEFL
jgi:Ca2+-binding EF-hand superfamily protein